MTGERARARVLLAAVLIAVGGAAVGALATMPAAPGPACAFGPGPVGNGRAIIATGIQMRVPQKGIVAALMASMRETRMRNVASTRFPGSLAVSHDGVSASSGVGVLQQVPRNDRVEVLMTPAGAARVFFNRLQTIPRWESMESDAVAQAVQMSAWGSLWYLDSAEVAARFYREQLPVVTVACSAPA